MATLLMEDLKGRGSWASVEMFMALQIAENDNKVIRRNHIYLVKQKPAT